MIKKYNDFLLEKKNFMEQYENVEDKVRKSKKLSAEMKEKILPLIVKTSKGFGGTKYNKGRVFDLSKPKIDGKTFKGVSLGADKNGFFVYTHRARSKSYDEIEKIPQKDINFIETTG